MEPKMEYDRYMPEKEPNMNFRIPRKRTAEESFGNNANYNYSSSYYDANSEKIRADGSFSSAASRSFSISNYRKAVPYYFPEKSESYLDLAIKPPEITTNLNKRIGFTQFPKSNFINEEYPKMSMDMKLNKSGSGFSTPLFGSGSKDSYFGENRSWGTNLSRGIKNHSVPFTSFADQNTILIGKRGEILGKRRGFLEKPSWNTQNVGSGSNLTYNRLNDDLNSGNTFERSFNGYNGANNFNKSFNDDKRGCNSFNENCYGGIYKNGLRDENVTQNNFKRSQDVNVDKVPSWKRDNLKFNDGVKNVGRYWNKTEKPKRPKPNIAPVAIPDLKDETLPKELRQMFQPLFCKLCSLQMTSNVMAKMHYVSKNHEKKIRKYLIELSEKTGEPLHPRAVTTNQPRKENEEDKNPRNSYCELCDLQLTSKQHADSHYMGKSHNAVRLGKKKPHGKGFFDPNGQWIRISKETNPNLSEGDDTFGMDFRKKPEESNSTSAQETIPSSSGKSLELFTCSLCSVSCVSQDQLNIHLGGSKHKKKLKMKGLSPDNFMLPKNSEQQDDNSATECAAPSVNIDESLRGKYITPNGYFYCEKCNLTVNSEIQFKQHLSSKKHAKKEQQENVV